jgi:hypothetical protein
VAPKSRRRVNPRDAKSGEARADAHSASAFSVYEHAADAPLAGRQSERWFTLFDNSSALSMRSG